jgi:Ala-tRNA(Pro) deacylase
MPPNSSPSVFEKIVCFLDEHQTTYRWMDHRPTRTSEEAAEVRGTSLSSGAKALLMKLYAPTGNTFGLMVFGADLRFDSKLACRATGAKKTRFASAEELLQMTGLEPGSVPPFGEPILPVKLYVDRGLVQQNEQISFNAGSLTRSVVMSAKDYQRISGAVFGHLTK